MADMNVLTNRYKPNEAMKPVPNNKLCPGPCGRVLKTLDYFKPYPDTYDGFMRLCVDCERTRSTRENRAYRLAAIAVYGSVCVNCGCSDEPGNSLQFDHTNNGGGEHRKNESISTMIRRIAVTGERITDYPHKEFGVLVDIELQLLCKNCHDEKTDADWPGFRDWLYAQHFAKKAEREMTNA